MDDNRNNLEILRHILTSGGMQVVSVNCGTKVLPAVRDAGIEGAPFDVGILDIQMPKMNGYEVVEQLNKAGLAAFPLIASSSLSDRNAKKCEELGFKGFMPKPVNRLKLLKMAELLLVQATGGEQQQQPQPILTQYSVREEAKQAVSILLAEDNIINQKLARKMLENGGYTVEIACDGKKVVEIFSAQPERYDLILMDIQMPELSGIEATEQIRTAVFTDIPIVAFTAHAMKKDKQKCLDVGMNDYMTKPIKREVVYEMVRKWVLERPRRR